MATKTWTSFKLFIYVYIWLSKNCAKFANENHDSSKLKPFYQIPVPWAHNFFFKVTFWATLNKMVSRQNIGGRKRKTKQSKAKNSNNKTLCAIFTWIVPRKYQNGCPNTTETVRQQKTNNERMSSTFRKQPIWCRLAGNWIHTHENSGRS